MVPRVRHRVAVARHRRGGPVGERHGGVDVVFRMGAGVCQHHQFVDAFMVGKWAGFFLHLLLAILYGVVGVLMLIKPVISAEAATFVMSLFFILGGLYQLIASVWTHLPGWGWQALNGAVATIMGFLVLAQWPVSGLWVIGLFVGIDLILYGWAWIALALDLHKM